MSLYRCALLVAAVSLSVSALGGERINHAGRILPSTPSITTPLLFNTPEADAVIASLQILPRDNAWNEDISRRPVLSNSSAMLAKIIAEIPNAATLRGFYEMNYVIVPANQPKINFVLGTYASESDPPPYPIPSNMPVEGWPKATGNTLVQNQTIDDGSDRHCIIVDPGNQKIYETWRTVLQSGTWRGETGVRFDLNTNNLRTDGFTSADASGSTMFAGLVRYDECQRGEIEHAIRCIVGHTRDAHIYPAVHNASSPPTNDPDTPAMGQRLRLKSTFTIPPTWTKESQTVARALMKYGCIVADNGNFFSISIAPDDRFSGNPFSNLTGITVNDFEVIQTTGATEGPRSPGAPVVDAGPDRTIGLSFPANLSPLVNGTNLTINWKMYSGPGVVTFANAASATTTATFSALGTYTLMLSADDGVHTPAYDALIVNVTATGGPDTTPPGTPGNGGGSGGLGSTIDSDGDGFSDELELALGTSPTDPTSTPFGGAAAGTVQPLTITKLSTSLNFTTTGRDSVSLSGSIPLPDGASAGGKTMVVDVGGVIDSFALDLKGKGVGTRGSARISIRAKKGVVLAQQARLQVKIKGDCAKALSDEGLTGTADARAESKSIYVQVLFNQTVFAVTQPQLWTAKAGKGGRSK